MLRSVFAASRLASVRAACGRTWGTHSSTFTRAFATSSFGDDHDDGDDSADKERHEHGVEKGHHDHDGDAEDVYVDSTAAEVIVPDKSDAHANALVGPNSHGIPSRVPVLPLYRRPLFPGIVAPLVISDQNFVERFLRTLSTHPSGMDKFPHSRAVGLFLVKNQSGDDKNGENSIREGDIVRDVNDLHDVGCLGQIIRIVQMKPAGLQLLVAGQRRIRITGTVPDQDLLSVQIQGLSDDPYDPNDTMIKAYTVEVVGTIKDITKLNPFFKEQLQVFLDQVNIHNPSELTDLAAALTTGDAAELQEVMNSLDVQERLSKVLNLLKSEYELSQVQMRIQQQLEEKINTQQRQYILNEQLKAIKRELGLETDAKEAVIDQFRKRAQELDMPEHARKVVQAEMEKLSSIESSSPEFNSVRNYLDWLTLLPWEKYTTDTLEIPSAQQILDEDHYGLDDVKERILEFIAVGSLRGDIQGKILCFSGPPGVGKTSIGRSIARALNREFFRFSVGGMTDVAEIKGHRRTYVGAMPGKIIRSLKSVQSSNPLILIDEIDKMGRGIHGDPASALLEVLDPEQNGSFLDHYLDVPYDLSKVLFVCTANVPEAIPEPLLDRMELIRLSGYILEEKLAIAKKYLVPELRKKCGLLSKNVNITDSALRELARSYCREAGVRSLKNHIDRVLRKVALQIARDSVDKVVVSHKNLHEFVGQPKFRSERHYRETPPGVTMGLAWTSMGGSTLYVETTAVPGSAQRNLTSTGKMGEVMQESTTIAYTLAKNILNRLEHSNRFFENNAIHMHIPEGATPKDGPSAGCTMVTSLLSLALNKNVRKNLAMTGEVSLTGKVLPIGGVKEKTIAAKRSGVRHIIFPLDNRRDFDELPDHVKQSLEPHFVEHYDEIIPIAFPEMEQP